MTAHHAPHSLSGGFTDPAAQSARAFRAMMQAMARPGQIQEITGALPPAPLSKAAGTAALVLLDPTTPVYLAGAYDCQALRDWITFHTGAPFAAPEAAAFAFGLWQDLQPLQRFAIGTAEYPDRSATLLVDGADLSTSGARLSGPGIKSHVLFSLPETKALQENAALYPLGLDFYFTAGDQIAALPRSTKIEDL